MVQIALPARLLARLARLLTVGLVLGALAGCGSSEPLQRDRFYSLEPAPLQAPRGAPLPATLLVNDLAARGFVGGK